MGNGGEGGGGGGGKRRRRRNKHNGLKAQSNAQRFVDNHIGLFRMVTVHKCRRYSSDGPMRTGTSLFVLIGVQ